MPALAFEIRDRVDEMLHGSRTRDLAVLRNMAHENHRSASPLCETNNLVRDRSDLGGRARRALYRVRPHRLDRVDDRHARAFRFQCRKNVPQTRRCREKYGRSLQTEPFRPHFDLVRRFLAGKVDGPECRSEPRPPPLGAASSIFRCRGRRRRARRMPERSRLRGRGRIPEWPSKFEQAGSAADDRSVRSTAFPRS